MIPSATSPFASSTAAIASVTPRNAHSNFVAMAFATSAVAVPAASTILEIAVM